MDEYESGMVGVAAVKQGKRQIGRRESARFNDGGASLDPQVYCAVIPAAGFKLLSDLSARRARDHRHADAERRT